MKQNRDLVQVIRERQQQEGLTLVQMAEKLSTTQATLSRIYNDQRGIGVKVLGGILAAYPDLKDTVTLFLSANIPQGKSVSLETSGNLQDGDGDNAPADSEGAL